MPLAALVTVGCLALPTIGYSLAIHRILSSNWSALRPCHVIQANYFAAVLAVLVHTMFLVTERNLIDLGDQICSHHALGLFLRVFHNFAVVLLQVDRLLAVQWPFLSWELTALLEGRILAGIPYQKKFSNRTMAPPHRLSLIPVCRVQTTISF